ncbi:MAG: hydantoinase/carbamoylase family amidase, partial [Alphaproteobacteria bacterium]|nr:hydantoinase/carbamoylase family amidase [Alphaproteobacteria bacterium]
MTDHRTIADAVTRQRALAEHLFDDLVALSRDPETGVTRASYGDEETRIHRHFGAIAETLGLTVTRDAVANTYMTLPGRDPTAKTILTGSHLDSVKQGGNFDGAAGVVAGLVACAALRDLGIQPRCDVSVMGVRAEESAWFGVSYIGSRGALGLLPDGALDAQRVDSGVRLADGIRAAGGDPEAVAARRKTFEPSDLKCFLELHIEQGPLLDRDGLPVGIVTGIPGNFRFPDARVVGEYGHVGLLKGWRHDAVTAASEFAMAMDALWDAWEGADKPMACTIGQFGTDPALHAMTKVPGALRFTLDVRAYDAAHLEELEQKTLAIIRSIEQRRGVRFELGKTARAAVGPMAPAIRDGFEAIATSLNIPTRRLGSPASHD